MPPDSITWKSVALLSQPRCSTEVELVEELRAPLFLEALLTLARAAGGEAPLPSIPSTAKIDEWKRLAGTEQLGALLSAKVELENYIETWEAQKRRAEERLPDWEWLEQLCRHAADVTQQQRVGHLLSPLPKEMRDDTAFHDRIHAFAPGWDFPKLDPREHLTDHFGLVSDFLSECWSRLRGESRVSVLQNRVFWGGALSGRDIEAVQKSVSGLIKLLFPDREMPVPDEDLEGIIRLALESRRRVKEQQKRCLKSEFRNTHFSYTLGINGIEQFVATPELHSDEAIDSDPLPPGRVWAVSLGAEAGHGLCRIEATAGPGSGVRTLNHPAPPAFRESVRVGEQNLYARKKELVGDRDPRSHEFSIQLRAMEADKSGAGLGLPVLVALVGALLERNTRGGTIIVGPLNLGGSMDLVHNPVSIAEMAVEKKAATLLLPVSARKALNELPDEMWTRISIEFYADPTDAVFKSLVE